MRSFSVISACIGVCLLVSSTPPLQGGAAPQRTGAESRRNTVRSGGHPVSPIIERVFLPELVLDLETAGLEEARELLTDMEEERCREKIAEYFYRRKPKHAIEPWPPYENARQRADEFMENRYILGTHAVEELPGDLSWRENPAGLANWAFLLTALDILRSVNDAYRLTGDARYIVKGKRLIIDFAEDNLDAQSLPSAFSWYDVAVAYRTIYLLDFWNQYVELKEADAAFTLLFIELLWRHGLYLANERFYSKSTNHGMYSNIALLRLSRAFPEFFDARSWKGVAVSRMEQQVRDNYTSEGLHKEYSPSYHVLTSRLLLRFKSDAAGDDDISFSGEFASKLEKIIANIPYLFHPDGMLSIIGDSRLVSAERMLELFPGDDPVLDCLRTNGKRGRAPEEDSKAFAEAQMFVMRSGWGRLRPYEEETCLIADFASYGLAHQHYDFMSFELCGRGYRWVTDLGPLTYNKDDPRRKYLVSGPAHNVLVPYTRRSPAMGERAAPEGVAGRRRLTDSTMIGAKIDQIGKVEDPEDRIAAYEALLNYNAGEHEEKILILIALSYMELESGGKKAREYLERVIEKDSQSEYRAVARELLATLDLSADDVELIDEPATGGIAAETHRDEARRIDTADSAGLDRKPMHAVIGGETKLSSGGDKDDDHYTADVADKEQSPTVDHWISNADFDYLEGRFCYNDYFTHSRAILFIKPHYFIVVDRAKAESPCLIKSFFHMPPAVEVAERGAGYVLSVGDSLRCLFLCLSRPRGAESRVVRGELEPEMQGWYAGRGRVFEEAPVVEYSFSSNGGSRYIAHLFVPLGGDDIDDYEIGMPGGDTWKAEGEEQLQLTIRDPHYDTYVSFLPSPLFFGIAADMERSGPTIEVIRRER